MKLKDLLINFEYTVQGNLDTEISDIIYDSRKVVKGTAFVCLKAIPQTDTGTQSQPLKKVRRHSLSATTSTLKCRVMLPL